MNLIARRNRKWDHVADYLVDIRYRLPLAPGVVLFTQAEMVERIEDAREDMPPMCVKCAAQRSTLTRRCARCRTYKPLNQFTLDPRTTLGVGWRCKACEVKRMTALRKRKQSRTLEKIRSLES